MGKCIKLAIHTDDTVVMVESREDLQQTVNELRRVCDKMMFKIDVSKSKTLVVRKDQRTPDERV